MQSLLDSNKRGILASLPFHYSAHPETTHALGDAKVAKHAYLHEERVLVSSVHSGLCGHHMAGTIAEYVC